MISAALAFSAHLGLTGSYSAVHPALWLEQEGWRAGAYLNSNEDVSLFAVRRFGGKRWIEVGVVSGYHLPVMLRAGVQANRRVSFWAAPAIKEGGERGAIVGVEFALF